MKKENLTNNASQDGYLDQTQVPPMSEELQQAIQNLIYRLRELGPLPN